ncbi:MAG: alpha-2-macroglobulin [Blastocatellia bacterium]|nr:alpha-2-macroglobulin [Blastocatellia bacterium]
MYKFKVFALVVCVCVALVGLRAVRAQQNPVYEKMKAEAEKYYTEKTYVRAAELYRSALELKLAQADERWAMFRLADAEWRAQAATNSPDTSKLEDAKRRLEKIISQAEKETDRDQIWAEAQESLGDYHWTRTDARNWYAAWEYYRQALEWWAGSRDLTLARDRYVGIVLRMDRTNRNDQYYYYGYYGTLPLEVLDNTLKLAKGNDEIAHIQYLIAMTTRNNYSDYERRLRIAEAFEAALKIGKSSEWYDDALYYYGEFMRDQGRIYQDEQGNILNKPDYVKALELFNRLNNEFQKGETRYYDQAKSAAENITKPTLSVSVSNIFLPNSEIQIASNWRNLSQIEYALYKVELNRDVKFAENNGSLGNWLETIAVTGREVTKKWSKTVPDKHDYQPGGETMRLEEKLPVGAYLLEAKSGAVHAREIILVTDTTLVVKPTDKKLVAFVCDALTGAPVLDSQVKLWVSWYDGNTYHLEEKTAAVGADGVALFDLAGKSYQRNFFVAAAVGDRQAFSQGYDNNYSARGQQEQWKVYAYTDKPAYRPGETVQWKCTVRSYTDGLYAVPAKRGIEYEINDARGASVKKGTLKLNQFGSAWDNFMLPADATLGEYRIYFYDEGRHTSIGQAQMFRLEEYKLPEFKVTVQTPEENGRKKAFKLGEKVEFKIAADYYFGGPVVNASVEAVVYQKVFYHSYQQPREYPWLYENENQRYYYNNYNRSEIQRRSLKTDAQGKASLTFETPRNSGNDFEYEVEARVIDASRREVTGSDSVRVTRQRFYVYPRTERYVYRPGEKISVDVKALDANNQPVQTEGTLKIFRDTWKEIWLDPTGREVAGDELKDLKRKNRHFPPPVKPGEKPWQPKSYGYEHVEVLTKTLRTDKEGIAHIEFPSDNEGYYRISMTCVEKGNNPIVGETTVWVASQNSNDFGYQSGNLDLILDKDTFRVGQTAPLLVTTPISDSYVLLCVEGADLDSYQVVHVTGNVKLVEVPVTKKDIPVMFFTALMVDEANVNLTVKQAIVPPAEQFLTVDVQPDKAEYLAREEGTFTITARNFEGKPVSAEVGLGVFDESVTYIQQDYAQDPRKFFYGAIQRGISQPFSMFQQKRIARLIEGKDKELQEDDLNLGKRSESERRDGPAAPAAATLSRQMSLEADSKAKTIGGIGYSTAGGEKADFGFIAKDERGSSVFRGNVFKERKLQDKKTDSLQEQTVANVLVRNDFRSSIFWKPDLVTDANGKAVVKVKFPDTLTTWKATARAVTENTLVGSGTGTTRTKQPLIVRLQTPRFFVENDLAVVSAVINNNTDKPITVTPVIQTEGISITGIVSDGKIVKGEQGPVKVEPNSDGRADWVVLAAKLGNANFKVTARGGQFSDGMELTIPIYEHGIEKYVAKSGKLRGDEAVIKLAVPAARKTDTTQMSVQVTPSMAVTMLDALPYLIDYPYGCTEQTMSRFLPAAVTAYTLKNFGIKPEDIAGKMFGGVEAATADKTHTRPKQDLKKLDDMAAKGLKRLYDFQHSDGGWGWWKEGESDHFMTAYVVWGMSLAAGAGMDVRSDVRSRGAEFLDKELVEEETNYDMQAWMLHAVASHRFQSGQASINQFQEKAFKNLWENRERLNAYTRALLALAAYDFGKKAEAKILVQNLENGVKIDSKPDESILISNKPGTTDTQSSVIGTAHWGEDGVAWRWSDGGVEATAFALKALVKIDPTNKLVEPVTNWLIKNRRGAQWSNTRDTAIVVLALNDFVRETRELTTVQEYEVLLNGTVIGTQSVDGGNMLSAPSEFAVKPIQIKNGDNEIKIRRKSGTGPLYFAARANYFTYEEPIGPEGNEIFVRRDYYRLKSVPTLLKGNVFEKELLADGEQVRSGERIEVVLTIEGKNNYEYLLFEDLKPAGLEAVEVKSGTPLYAKEIKGGWKGSKPTPNTTINPNTYTGRTRWVYQELRDRKVAMFIDKLPEGVWELRYEFRAEAPGVYHALPVLGHAMYVPEIRCNSAEMRVKVEEKLR